jgi:multidrug efflux system membrane fusion protein
VTEENAPIEQTPGSTESASSSCRDPHPPKRRLWVVIVSIVVVVLAAWLILHRLKTAKPSDTADEAPVPTIKVATASRDDIGLYVEALGTVTPLATINLYSQISGRVVAVHYSEGQMVRKGDPLIDIDPRPYEAQLVEAEGTLEHDKALLVQAQIDLARYKDASTNGAVARQTLEDQQQSVAQYQGTVKNDAGQVQYAQVQLSYCHIAAPITGRVGLRLVDPRNTVFSGSSSALVVITQLQPISVVFNVAEDNIGRLHDEIRHRGNLRVDAYDRSQMVKIATGKLLTLDNQIDTTTGTVRFRGQFDNADLNLYPNQFVNAKLLVNTLHNATLVPSAAIQHNGVKAFVYLVSGQTTKIQPIRELTTDGDRSAVEGIQPDDTVATSGFDKLQDGTKVTIQSGTKSTGEGQQGGGTQ